jgi:hypothetical protein
VGAVDPVHELEASPENAPKRASRGLREDRACFPWQCKMTAVARLIRGEDLDALSRELGVTGAIPERGGRCGFWWCSREWSSVLWTSETTRSPINGLQAGSPF